MPFVCCKSFAYHLDAGIAVLFILVPHSPSSNPSISCKAHTRQRLLVGLQTTPGLSLSFRAAGFDFNATRQLRYFVASAGISCCKVHTYSAWVVLISAWPVAPTQSNPRTAPGHIPAASATGPPTPPVSYEHCTCPRRCQSAVATSTRYQPGCLAPAHRALGTAQAQAQAPGTGPRPAAAAPKKTSTAVGTAILRGTSYHLLRLPLALISPCSSPLLASTPRDCAKFQSSIDSLAASSQTSHLR